MNSSGTKSPVQVDRVASKSSTAVNRQGSFLRAASLASRFNALGATSGLGPRPSSGRRRLRAFTVAELLAVVLVLVLGALLLVPALAQTKPNVHAFQCLENLRRLQGAVTMYTHDNHDFFPPNPDDANTLPGYNWCPGDAAGGMPPGRAGASDMCNPDLLKDPAKCLVAPYLGGNVGVFKCPDDPRFGRYSGSDTTQSGRIIPAARSISMNQSVGTVDPSYASSGAGHSGKPTLKVNGPWLDGSHHHRADSPYATFGKMSDFGFASPASIFVLLDEDPWSINDAAFGVIAAQPTLIDYAASYHNNGGNFLFADGHAETHQWLSTVMTCTGSPAQTAVPPGTLAYKDWYWLASHATKNTLTGNVP